MISLYLLVLIRMSTISPLLQGAGVMASLGLAVGHLALTGVSPGRRSPVFTECRFMILSLYLTPERAILCHSCLYFELHFFDGTQSLVF